MGMSQCVLGWEGVVTPPGYRSIRYIMQEDLFVRPIGGAFFVAICGKKKMLSS